MHSTGSEVRGVGYEDPPYLGLAGNEQIQAQLPPAQGSASRTADPSRLRFDGPHSLSLLIAALCHWLNPQQRL